MSYIGQYLERKLNVSIVQGLKLSVLREMAVIDYLSYTKLGICALIQCIENELSVVRYILDNIYLQLIGREGFWQINSCQAYYGLLHPHNGPKEVDDFDLNKLCMHTALRNSTRKFWRGYIRIGRFVTTTHSAHIFGTLVLLHKLLYEL